MNTGETRSPSSSLPANSAAQPQSQSQSQSQPRRFFHFWRCFWLLFLVGSLGYAWYCYYVPGNNVAWAESFTTAQTQAAQTGKPMILFFTGDWCVPCRIMKRQVWADEQVTDSVNAMFIAVMVDVDDPDAADVVSRYRVGATPKTIITDPQGEILQQETGGMSKAEFLALLEHVQAR